LCNLYNVPYVPGCFTPTEVQSALTYGSDLIKIFPGSIAGKGVIKEIQGPFPYANIMPSGVSLDNMNEWFDKGPL
jgi:2-keto-3-deoxy-6-phosphogluconate aldolase